MAKLTDEEQSLLKRLSAKAEAPDEPPMGKSVSFNLDLGDEKQIARAIKLGLLSPFSDDDDDNDDDGEKDKDAVPKRGGYFKEGK